MKILIFSAVFSLCFISVLSASDYYISPSGNNSTGNGSISSPWRTIEYAIEFLNPGDNLYLREGVYNEQLISLRSGAVNNYITISAYNDENAYIDGTGVSSGNNGAIITHSFIRFVGFTIRNWADAGMEISNCEFIELIKLKVTAVSGGIHMTGTVHDFILDSCLMFDFSGEDGGFGFDATPEGAQDSIYNGMIKDCKSYLSTPATGNCDGFALGHDRVSDINFYNCEVYGVGDGFDISGKNIILERCSAHGSTFGGGYKLWRDEVKLINCIGYDNTSNVELDYDFTVNQGVNARLINCTFFGSSVYNIWIENCAGGSTLAMYNCILAGATNTGLNFDGDSVSCYTGDYNLFHMNNPERMIATSELDFSLTQVFNNEWTAHSGQDAHTQVVFDAGTLFMDTLYANPNLHILGNSLAVDNGTNLPDAPLFDFDNCPRNVGLIDIGAHEFGACGPVEVNEPFSDKNNSYNLRQNYPNPFNPSTRMSYTIPRKSFISIKIFDLLGKEVSELVNEEKEAGKYKVVFNATNLPSGVYFYQLRVGDFIETRKMILIK